METNELLLTLQISERARRIRVLLNPDIEPENLANMDLAPYIAVVVKELKRDAPVIRQLLRDESA